MKVPKIARQAFFGLIILSALVALSTCQQPGTTGPTPVTYNVLIEVKGSGALPATSGTVIYEYGKLSSQLGQANGVSFPWTFSYTGGPYDVLYIVGISNTGSLTVTIYRNGAVVSSGNDDADPSQLQVIVVGSLS